MKVETAGRLPIVMGLDQHRAQITAEWIDLATARSPAGGWRQRTGLRSGGSLLASRDTGSRSRWRRPRAGGWWSRSSTGWVHLAEPAETSGLRGPKKRPKTDWADARHLRELLLIGRLPESWIPPGHILDLRAQIRCRHTLSHQRTEWQQRIQSVLYHHGCPHKRDLMTAAGLEWLAAQPLPVTAREQVTVALTMIDAFDIQLAPLTGQLRDYGRRQPGCKALIAAHYGIGPLCAVTILAELGDARRFGNSGDAVRYGGLDIAVKQSDQHRAPGHLSRQGPPALRWALYEAAQQARHPRSPGRDYYLHVAHGRIRRRPQLRTPATRDKRTPRFSFHERSAISVHDEPRCHDFRFGSANPPSSSRLLLTPWATLQKRRAASTSRRRRSSSRDCAPSASTPAYAAKAAEPRVPHAEADLGRWGHRVSRRDEGGLLQGWRSNFGSCGSGPARPGVRHSGW